MANANARQMSQGERNAQARAIVLSSGINRWQSVFDETFTQNNLGRVVNIPPQYVGLIKRFVVRITATVQRGAAESYTRTPFGPANILSQVVFNDLSNQSRIQTAGWHLAALAGARRMMQYGAAFANDLPMNFGSNYAIYSAPQNFAGGDQVISMIYELPVSYGDRDLRGAIYAGVVNATMNLQLTINPNFAVGNATDPTLACYQSNGATAPLTMSSLRVQVYQNFLDQLQMGKGGPILPGHDLATAYLIQNTVATGMAAGQDFGIPYANYRDFMSTFVIYDQAGTLNPGTDINYWALRAANFTNIWQYDPILAVMLNQRNLIGNDFPAGCYYFDHRDRPINTVQYGNIQLMFNPATVAAGSQALVGYEMLTIINQVTQAGSLYNT